MVYLSDVTKEMVLLMRGFFAMPVISSLGRLGVLDNILSQESFTVNDFKNIPNKKVLLKSFQYLSRIGLLEKAGSTDSPYRSTRLGQEVFRRHSSFYVPHSYHEYMNSFKGLLENTALNLGDEVDRLENVIGSGVTHRRYFLPAISFLKRKVPFDLIADIGCGNGYFLREALQGLPDKKAVGIDISEISIEVTEKNLKQEYPGREITIICSDALDLENWGKKLKITAGHHQIVLSMWFLIHEISRNDPQFVVRYFNEIHRLFPAAWIVTGELVRHCEKVLSEHRGSSIMPEYLFFHDLSGQGILSWDEYQYIISQIPYRIVSERVFDELPDGQGRYSPSAFVWCLEPKSTL